VPHSIADRHGAGGVIGRENLFRRITSLPGKYDVYMISDE